jgi:D-lactate dehydrogenase (cytochrome)
MVKRAVELEGTVTGEHGVGLIKRDYLEHEVGESTVDAMRRVSFYKRLDHSLSRAFFILLFSWSR